MLTLGYVIAIVAFIAWARSSAAVGRAQANDLRLPDHLASRPSSRCLRTSCWKTNSSRSSATRCSVSGGLLRYTIYRGRPLKPVGRRVGSGAGIDKMARLRRRVRCGDFRGYLRRAQSDPRPSPAEGVITFQGSSRQSGDPPSGDDRARLQRVHGAGRHHVDHANGAKGQENVIFGAWRICYALRRGCDGNVVAAQTFPGWSARNFAMARQPL